MFIERTLQGGQGTIIERPNDPPFRLSDGRRIVGSIPPAPACYTVPTEDGTPAEVWPVLTGTTAVRPHDFVREVAAYREDVPERVWYRDVTWAELEPFEAFKQRQRELANRYFEVLRGGFIMTQGAKDYWLRSGPDAIGGRQQFQTYIERNGWPMKQDGVTPQEIPVWLISQNGVTLWDKVKVDEAQWNAVMDASAKHHQDVTNATDAADDALVAALVGAGDIEDPGTWTGTTQDVADVDFDTFDWPANPPTNGLA